ncbi:ATP-dependent helicase [Flavobacterium johnsoniae]|uniref:UvrD-helicase domain-containing protein n=1 Tax=Flavobacterium johnsoniae TaxID=986 RepID=UPI0025AF8730|nr:ATP-dependent helicase [Flavobacterium johnsoniae]WJS93370.1 ATP-dependent helicase [Flavobacterium johnsoniae]
MYSKLSDGQRKILDYNQGNVVVKACPGSGKTYSLAARISRLLREPDLGKKGLAVISFTNIACQEIEDRLSSDFSTPVPLRHPHFLGTIDSFINTFIFLPFGHLIMGCPSRPELVGEPHGPWSVKKFDKDYDQYFDKTTFNSEDILIRIAPYQAFHFKWNYITIGGTVNGHITNIINSKWALFKKGYANQSDANYISLKVLEKYPLIAENVAKKFVNFLIDECQDTNDIHMKIIDILNNRGNSNIMLIGDRDQSIFEWNEARPELFDAKYNIWDKILLYENRRSSQHICNFIRNLSSFSEIKAVNERVKDSVLIPSILGYKMTKKASKKDPTVITAEESHEAFRKILDDFIKECESNGIIINKENVAVLYRGTASSKYLGLSSDVHNFETIPWLRNHYHVKGMIKGKHMYEHGGLNKGYKLLEKSYFEALLRPADPNFYCSGQFISNKIEALGIKEYRREIFKFIDALPFTKDKTLNTWIKEANKSLLDLGINIILNIESSFGDVMIDDYFGEDLNSERLHPFYFGTVHSVKGKTFQAVLLLLGKKSVLKNYETILKADPKFLKSSDLEELRIVYVALSRPELFLKMAVPDSDVKLWTDKLLQNSEEYT